MVTAYLQEVLPEVADAICIFLNPGSIAAMTRSCKHLYKCCTATLYRDVVLDDLAQSKFRRSVRENPQLSSYVHGITFDHGEFYADHYADALLPLLPNLRHLRFFAHEQGFFDRGMDEDSNAVGLGLWWPGPDQRKPSDVRAAASKITTWLPALETCT
jgi:hypothetical protein